MASKSPKAASSIPRAVQIARILWRPQNRGPVLTAGVILAAIVGLLVAWNRWGAPTTHGPDYLVTPDKITITPQPAWIHADVKAEVVRAANLSRLDLRDRELAQQVSQAFALHAWIAKVVRVEKRYPAQLAVTLEYRRPIAAVELAPGGRRELLFVDAEGSCSRRKTSRAIRQPTTCALEVINSTPSVYGSPSGGMIAWREPPEIAAAWGERFKRLASIAFCRAKSAAPNQLRAADATGDTRVLWGPAPSQFASSEPSAEQKIAKTARVDSPQSPTEARFGPPQGGERLIDLRQ